MDWLRPLCVASGLLLLASGAVAGELRVSIDGLRSSDGTILIGLYDSAESFNRAIELSDKEGFLNDPNRVAGVAVKANASLAGGVVLTNLQPGRYALILFHDENGNGRLDKNFWGVPTEPYGFSNNAQGFLGPPSFEDAAMTLDDSDKAVVVTLVYHSSGRYDSSADREDGETPAVAKQSTVR
jgi:uncharacterized protein (DUF2141 family)